MKEPDGARRLRPVRLWREEAEKSGLFVVGGMLEKDEDALYNADSFECTL